jgi:hypothetical protein
MRYLFLIIILSIFSSCQARDFKSEINLAFNKNDIPKVQKLLGEYYQINGSDDLLEISYIKLAILNKDLQKILDLYKNTKYISVKKNEELLKSISKLIIDENQKIPLKNRTRYYENSLRVFPYSENIYNEYLVTLLKLHKVEDAFKVYLKYDEVFNKTSKYLQEIIYFKLKAVYEKDKSITVLRFITKLKNKESISFLENEILNNPKVLLNLFEIPDGFDLNIIKNIIPNQSFLLRKTAINFFIRFAKLEEVNETIIKLYSSIDDDRLKTFIYYCYYKRFNKEIDENLIGKLLKSDDIERIKPVIDIIRDFKLKKYTNELKILLGKPKNFKGITKSIILKVLSTIDESYTKEFVSNLKKVDMNNTKMALKRENLLNQLKIKSDCTICSNILKNETESQSNKAIALNLMIKNKQDYSFFKEYDNIIYYNIFLKNSDILDDKMMEELSFIGYTKWKDSRMLHKYLSRLNLNQINTYFSQEKIKNIKDKYYMELLYYSHVLSKTNEKNTEFEEFILKKKFFKLEYIDLFVFNEKQIRTLINLYVLENREDFKIKIIEKIINILNK